MPSLCLEDQYGSAHKVGVQSLILLRTHASSLLPCSEERSALTSTPPPLPSPSTDARTPSGVNDPIFVMPQRPLSALPPQPTPHPPPSALPPPPVVQGAPSALPLRLLSSAPPLALLGSRMLAITTTTTTTTVGPGEGQRGCWALAVNRHMREHSVAATRSPVVRPSLHLHSRPGGETRVAPGWAGSDLIVAGREGRPQALRQIWPRGAMFSTALPGVSLQSLEASVSQSRKRPPPY